MNPKPSFARRPWSFGLDIRDRNHLKGDEPFASLAQEIRNAVAATGHEHVRFQIECPRGKRAADDPLLKRLGCSRASWRIPLEPVLLDKFFNGRMGIRAQYYASPYHGAAMNAQLLALLRATLLKLAASADPSADRKLIQRSLLAESAKTWISEKNLQGKKIIRASELTLSEQEIQNDWLDVARLVKNGNVESGQHQLYSAALNGVRAPIPDQLEIKGGWIASPPGHREYVTPAKWDRDCQLFMFGFT